MLHGLPRIPIPQSPDSPEQAREELARLLRERRGIEESLNCKKGCTDRELLESLLKHDSPFALLRSLGFNSDVASLATRLLKDSALTPRVRDLANKIEDKLTPRAAPSPARTPVMRKKGMKDCEDSVFDWRAQALTPRRSTPSRLGDSGTPRRTARFQVGQSVRAAFSEDGLRMVGVVTCASPLEIRPQGMAESFQFPVVEAEETVSPDKCSIKTSEQDSDLRALEMAKLCIQQGLPQMAKVYLSMVTVNDEGPDMDKLAEECVDRGGVDGSLSQDTPSPVVAKVPEVPKLWQNDPVMVSIAEEMDVGAADEGAVERHSANGFSVQETANEQPPGAMTTSPTRSSRAGDTVSGDKAEATVVSDAGAPVAPGADGVLYACGHPLASAGQAGSSSSTSGCCGPEDFARRSRTQRDTEGADAHRDAQLHGRHPEDRLDAQGGARRAVAQPPQLSGAGPAQALQVLFQIGQLVRFADNEADEWKEGVVTDVNPLMVRPQGYEESFEFNLVEPLDSPVEKELEADGHNTCAPQTAKPATGQHTRQQGLDANALLQSLLEPEAGQLQDGVSGEDRLQHLPSDNSDDPSNYAMCTARSTISNPAIPPWHHLAKTIDTCAASPAPTQSQLGLSRAGPNLSSALLLPPGEEKAMGSAWLSCCFAR